MDRVESANFLIDGDFAKTTVSDWIRKHKAGVLPTPKPIAARWKSVSAGAFHTCGVRDDGQVTCWGSNTDTDNNYIGQADAPPGKFESVSAGAFHTCGIRENRTIKCWGDNTYEQLHSPFGEFYSISAGSVFTTVACVSIEPSLAGEETKPAILTLVRLTHPPGAFKDVDAGAYHTCGIRVGGVAECWGS